MEMSDLLPRIDRYLVSNAADPVQLRALLTEAAAEIRVLSYRLGKTESRAPVSIWRDAAGEPRT